MLRGDLYLHPVMNQKPVAKHKCVCKKEKKQTPKRVSHIHLCHININAPSQIFGFVTQISLCSFGINISNATLLVTTHPGLY